MIDAQNRILVTIILLISVPMLVLAVWGAVTSGAAGSAPSTAAITSAATTPAPVPVDDSVYVEDRVRLNDGREVTCLRYRDKLLSCDWNGAGATADAQR